MGLLIIRRFIMGDIAVTLVDLAQRGLLSVEDAGSWRVQRIDRSEDQDLLGYERSLLAALPVPADGASPPALPDLADAVGPGLARVRAEIEREAVRQGWARRWRRGGLTASGKELAAELVGFGRQLRQLKADPGEQTLAGALLPYGLRLHLVSRDQEPLARFATAWADAFGHLPGWRPPEYKRPEYDDHWPMRTQYYGTDTISHGPPGHCAPGHFTR